MTVWMYSICPVEEVSKKVYKFLAADRSGQVGCGRPFALLKGGKLEPHHPSFPRFFFG